MLEPMRKIGCIHTFEDERFRSWMVRASVAVLVAGAVVAVVWLVLSMVAGAPVPALELAGVFGGGPDAHPVAWCVAMALGVVLPLFVHELVHALAFKALAPSASHVSFGADWGLGMLYACAEGVVYTRRSYLVIALAPTVVVTLLVALAGAMLAWPLWAIATATVHLAGCTGDWGYALAIHRDRSIAYCEDTTWGVQFYAAGEGEGAR